MSSTVPSPRMHGRRLTTPLSDFLDAKRRDSGWPPLEMWAETLGVSDMTLRRWTSGVPLENAPHRSTMERVAVKLGVPADYLWKITLDSSGARWVDPEQLAPAARAFLASTVEDDPDVVADALRLAMLDVEGVRRARGAL